MYEKFTEGSTSDFTDKTLNASNSSSIQLCFSNISCHMLSVAHVEIIITHPTLKQSKMKILSYSLLNSLAQNSSCLSQGRQKKYDQMDKKPEDFGPCVHSSLPWQALKAELQQCLWKKLLKSILLLASDQADNRKYHLSLHSIDSILLAPMDRVQTQNLVASFKEFIVHSEQLDHEQLFFYSQFSLRYTSIDIVPPTNSVIGWYTHILTLLQFKLLHWSKINRLM